MENHEKWQAVLNNDAAYDGKFFYAVKSTGVFCRPSCKSRPPKLENLEYFSDQEDALKAGYRPCKRCRPDLMEYQPILDMAESVKHAIDHYFNERELLSEEFKKIGVSQHRMVEIFKEQYQMTPSEYIDNLKINLAKERLSHSTDSIVDISLSLGFESITAFYGFFRKHTEMSPGRFRNMQKPAVPEHNWLTNIYETSFGKIKIGSDGESIISSQFCFVDELCRHQVTNPVMDEAVLQLEEYFSGKRKVFNIPLSFSGTNFQLLVWKALHNIPYGHTQSYKQVAQSIKKSGASRAIGMANNKNPLLIFIPCHRVVGASGDLVGYAGGLEVKRRLLELELKYR